MSTALDLAILPSAIDTHAKAKWEGHEYKLRLTGEGLLLLLFSAEEFRLLLQPVSLFLLDIVASVFVIILAFRSIGYSCLFSVYISVRSFSI